MNDGGSPALRQACVDRLGSTSFDVLVVGGGINGAVSAAALAARGAQVALIDRSDFGCATSQESSNLVWGGIKYLETFEFGLVFKLCRARNELLRSYPTAVREIRFYTAHPRAFRHGRWKLVAGSLLYWALGNFFTRPPRPLSRRTMSREQPAIVLDELDGGFEYSDAWLPDSDARFVWTFVRSALDHGCAAANYVEALGSRHDEEGWVTRVRDAVTGRELDVRSRAVVNACGPWADRLNGTNGVRTAHRHVLSKGIHLLVDRIAPPDRVLTFFADDGRFFFAIPMGSRTCIGTTDTPVEQAEVGVTPEDRRFVLDNINKRLRLPRPLEERDIVAERCGVRPLVIEGDDATREWMQLSRKHAIETDAAARHVTIFGGKLTDCLNVGEEICAEVTALGIALPHAGRHWWGEPPAPLREAFLHQARLMGLDARPAGGDEPPAERLWRRHGAEALSMLEAIRRDPRQADELVPGAGLLRCELEATARREMVVRLDDFLRRRTQLAQVVRRDELRRAPGLAEAARALFGANADEQLTEYFDRMSDPSESPFVEQRAASKFP